VNRLSLAVLAVLATSAQAPAPETPVGPAPGAEFAASAAAVVLDVVVRDGKGRPVHGLTAADFEVYEDGAKQTIESLQDLGAPATGGPAPLPAAPAADAATPAAVDAPGTVVAFLFDQLGAEARASAHKAALASLKGTERLEGAAGVFAIDTSLRTLQAYTSDGALVRKALGHAAAVSASRFPAEVQVAPSTEDLLSLLIPRETAAVAGADSGRMVAPDDVMGELPPRLPGMSRAQRDMMLVLARIARRMERFYEALAREQQGYLTTNALMSMVASLREAPGRKSIVFFSEGLALPPAVQAHFQSVLDAATRANVSVYAVDAAGLRVTSTLAESRGEIQSYTARKKQTEQGGSGIALRELEVNEDALQRDPHAGLGALADQTGGFLIQGSNDLGRGLRAIQEDMRERYVLAYTPSNQEYDGRFRRVEVRVARRGLRVRTRQGYYALRAVPTDPVLPYEAPALAVLDRRPRPRAFALRAGGLSFPDPAGGRRVPLLVSVPARGLAWRVDGGRYRADFAIVARVKSADGAVVRKVGQPYDLRGPVAQLEAARGSEILFYREARLPPGRYTFEAVVYDALTRQAAVSESELVVPDDAPGRTWASSLVVVKAAERIEAGREGAGALTVNDLILYPVLEEPLPRTRPLLTFFVSVCVPPGTPAPPATIELWSEDALVDRADVELPAPDDRGCLRHLAGLPLAGRTAGAYDLRMRIGSGDAAVVRSAPVALVD
jgi:VWFA-related protein